MPTMAIDMVEIEENSSGELARHTAQSHSDAATEEEVPSPEVTREDCGDGGCAAHLLSSLLY